MNARAKVVQAITEIRKTLHGYAYVRGVAAALPDRITPLSSKEDFIKAVEEIPLKRVDLAWAQPAYLEYLRALDDPKFKTHLESAIHIRERFKGRHAVHLQGRETLPASGRNVQEPGPASSVGSVQRAGDRQD